MSDIDEVPEWVECDCDPNDPCGYCNTAEPYWGKS